jgi:tight adherence protein B
MDQVTLIYLMTFIAVVSAVFVFWSTLAEAAKAKEERMDADRMASMRTEDIGDPIERFVRKGQLFRLRMTFALIPGVVILIVLILTGVKQIAALVLVPLLLSVIGSCLPIAYFRFLVKKRQELFDGDILDFTLGIANALRSGMALPQALEKVGARSTGPMQEELSIVLREYRLGADLVMALDRMNRRMPSEDIRLLVSAIRLTTETGGSLATVLAEMAAMIRARRELFDKIKALTAEGRFEALVMSCAPLAAFFILYFQQPEMMRPLYTTGIGWTAIGAVVALVAAGFFTIRKIVSIEV